jgi:hypothetical protein
MKEYYSIPQWDYDGKTNPLYPVTACKECCESNSKYFYESERGVPSMNDKWKPHAACANSSGFCEVCGRYGVALYYTEAYRYPEFLYERKKL